MTERALVTLAERLGVQPSFTDAMKRRRTASTGSLLAAASALLGDEVPSPGAAARILSRLERDRATALIEPVVVAWDGRPPEIELHAPTNDRVDVTVELDDGDHRSVRVPVRRTPEGRATIVLDGDPWPTGEHRLVVEPGRRRPAGQALVLSAPTRVGPPPSERSRGWGVFLPLHALVTERDWGIGDLTGFAELADWVRSLGGGVTASLPILARFPGEPSPYSPASRLFWDERYVDVERELAAAAPATKRFARSPRFAAALDALRASPLVDDEAAARAKREVLGRLAVDRREDPDVRRAARRLPELEPYARFRAAGEGWGRDWRSWPSGAREGRLRSRDVDADALAYHRFAQVVADEQVAEVGRRSAEGGAGLYLDMPIGTHPDGFDVWRYRDDFAEGMNVGAPPDAFFPGGQDWGFPPVHPLRARERGYGYVRDCLRHVFRHAGIVRVDHVMGLHRLWWVPHGVGASDGVYVRYPAEEWYAALSLEAHRHGTVVVGEDLGTVPRVVRSSMRRHGMLRSYVVQYETVPGRERLPEPAADSVATVNTHDMPTFAAFWRGDDVADRLEDGLLDEPGAERERRDRAGLRRQVLTTLREGGVLETEEPSEREVLEALLVWLGRSGAADVVVNLEDLWSELRPVNVPGVTSRPNWRGKASRSLEELRDDGDIARVLRRLDAARRGSDARRTDDEEAA